MSARNAVENLLYTYAERIDAGDLEGVADLFAEAEITNESGGAVRRGREQVLEMYRAVTRIYPDCGTPRTRHVTTNVIVEADEERGTAASRSYYTVFQQTSELALQPIIAGRYHDSFARIDGEWRFTSRRIFCDLFGDLSHHLLVDASALSLG
jgi:3-phenylpropionate/cinnamic acid dioxygenase small subunit